MSSAYDVQRFLTIEDGIDETSASDQSASGETAISSYGEARDEIKEIQNISRIETRLIRTWRIILLVLLVITAAAVSSITYILLQQEEYAAFQASVRIRRSRDQGRAFIFRLKLTTSSRPLSCS
jgi:hypothetical protein